MHRCTLIVLNVQTEWTTNVFEQIKTHLPDCCTCILEEISLFGMRAGEKGDGKGTGDKKPGMPLRVSMD